MAQASSVSPGISTERSCASGLPRSASSVAVASLMFAGHFKAHGYFFLTISARKSRSFGLMMRSFAGPMRISSFCPAELLSRFGSAYS